MTEHHFPLSDLKKAMQAVVDGGHSVYSPSGSEMWLGCSGSLLPNIFAPDDSGVDAATGTVAHWVGEQWLDTGVRPDHLVGQKKYVPRRDQIGFLIKIDEAMLDHVERYVDWCSVLPGDHFVETKVYFSQITPIPDQGGTADHVACTWRRMVITDLKYGEGLKVYAKMNTQARLYALGFFYEWDWLYDFQEIEIRIAQPRLGHFDTWIITRAELLEFADYAEVRAYAAWEPNAPRTPSEKACQWCRVKLTCTANIKMMFDMTAGVFTSVDKEISTESMAEFKESLVLLDKPEIADVARLSTSDLALIFGFKSQVIRFYNTASVELARRAAEGAKVPRWKLVEGRANRVIANEKSALDYLINDLGLARSDLMKQQMASPAEIEVLLRKHGYKMRDLPELLKPIVRKPKGRPTLAHEYDPRPELIDVTADVFGDTTQTDKFENEEI